MSIPTDLKYARTHEWVRIDDDGSVYVGITAYAQEALGDIVFVELPDEGTALAAGDEVGVIESVKAASDLYSPLTGEIIEINAILTDTPELINQDPYGEGWIFRIQPDDAEEIGELLEADDYAEQIGE